MSRYFRFYFDKPKEELVKKIFLSSNPFRTTHQIERVGSSIFAYSPEWMFSLYDGEDYSHWEFYSEMDSVFHFKAKSILDTGPAYDSEELRERKVFADSLDREKMPFYLLAHTDHNAQVLIRGLTKEKEGIINPNCNALGLDENVLDLVKGLNYREHEFAKDFFKE